MGFKRIWTPGLQGCIIWADLPLQLHLSPLSLLPTIQPPWPPLFPHRPSSLPLRSLCTWDPPPLTKPPLYTHPHLGLSKPLILQRSQLPQRNFPCPHPQSRWDPLKYEISYCPLSFLHSFCHNYSYTIICAFTRLMLSIPCPHWVYISSWE